MLLSVSVWALLSSSVSSGGGICLLNDSSHSYDSSRSSRGWELAQPSAWAGGRGLLRVGSGLVGGFTRGGMGGAAGSGEEVDSERGRIGGGEGAGGESLLGSSGAVAALCSGGGGGGSRSDSGLDVGGVLAVPLDIAAGGGDLVLDE